MSDPLEELARILADATPDPVATRRTLDPAAVRLRNASAADLPAALRQWRDALGRIGPGSVLRSLDLPPLPGPAEGLPRAIIAGDARLVAGWRSDAALGPFVVRASHTAVTTGVVAAADHRRPDLIGLLPAADITGALDAGPVKLQGALAVDPDDVGATGTLAFSSGALTGGALGRVESRDGVVSFLAVLGARFVPGVQIGFGFEVSGLGGVLGVNVGVDTDQLRRRLADGSAVALFFPADPEAREQLLPAARDTFRPRSGSVVAGPSVELTWLQVAGSSALRLSVVALLELPRARILVLGRGVVEVPPMLSLRLGVLGEIDAPRGFYAADLAVVEGRIMGIFRASGTAALRVSTSTPAVTLFTLGGFYPGYRTEAPGLPTQRRLSFGPDLPLPITFRFEGYLAFAGGTFQAGARFEIGFDVGVLSAHGFLSFDAIVQLDPFHLTARLTGGVHVEALGTDFAGVDFHGNLDAPGPVVVSGRVRVKFLGVPASWNDRFVLGRDRRPPDPPAITDLAAVVAATVTGRNVSGTGGTDPHVRLDAPDRDGDLAVVHPFGAVRWSQDVVPLGIEVRRARGRRLTGPRTVRVVNLEGSATTDGVTASFSPASFVEADRDTLLTLPAYEELPSGVEVPLLMEQDLSAVVGAGLAYDERYPDDTDRQPSLLPLLVGAAVRERLRNHASAAGVRLVDPRLAVRPEAWSVRGPGSDGTPGSRTAAVVGVGKERQQGIDAVALPVAEVAHSAAGLWEAS